MIKLSTKEQEVAKCFITSCVIVPAHIFDSSIYNAHYYTYSCSYSRVQILYDEIVNRNFAFDLVDSALQYATGLRMRNAQGNLIHRTAEQLAEYLAWFCQECNLIWDDSIKSTYEMDAYKQTLFGGALWKAERFYSQTQVASTGTSPKAKVVVKSATTNSKQAPQNNYKSSGGQSQNIINLVGTPGVKIAVQGNKVYRIIADKVGANVPNAFVKPLASGYQTAGGTNKVCFGSGNGYTDCTCFFDDLTKANAALTACQADFKDVYTNIRLESATPDANGYFCVRTVYGDCLIKARKMNENLAEDEAVREVPIGNMEVYDEWLFKSLS